MPQRSWILGVVIAWLMAANSLPAADVSAEDRKFFDEKVLPIFKKHCFECHSAKAKKVESGLKLDTREATLRGGEMGPILKPGRPEESPLIAALKYQKLEMPPAAKLPSEVIEDLENWIRRGAPDPREE